MGDNASSSVYVRTRDACLPNVTANHARFDSCYSDFGSAYNTWLIVWMVGSLGVVLLSTVLLVTKCRRSWRGSFSMRRKSDGATKQFLYQPDDDSISNKSINELLINSLTVVAAVNDHLYFYAIWDGLDPTESFIPYHVLAVFPTRTGLLLTVTTSLVLVTVWRDVLEGITKGRHKVKVWESRLLNVFLWIAILLMITIPGTHFTSRNYVSLLHKLFS
jgi:hypothetical protein